MPLEVNTRPSHASKPVDCLFLYLPVQHLSVAKLSNASFHRHLDHFFNYP